MWLETTLFVRCKLRLDQSTLIHWNLLQISCSVAWLINGFIFIIIFWVVPEKMGGGGGGGRERDGYV